MPISYITAAGPRRRGTGVREAVEADCASVAEFGGCSTVALWLIANDHIDSACAAETASAAGNSAA